MADVSNPGRFRAPTRGAANQRSRATKPKAGIRNRASSAGQNKRAFGPTNGDGSAGQKKSATSSAGKISSANSKSKYKARPQSPPQLNRNGGAQNPGKNIENRNIQGQSAPSSQNNSAPVQAEVQEPKDLQYLRNN